MKKYCVLALDKKSAAMDHLCVMAESVRSRGQNIRLINVTMNTNQKLQTFINYYKGWRIGIGVLDQGVKVLSGWSVKAKLS